MSELMLLSVVCIALIIGAAIGVFVGSSIGATRQKLQFAEVEQALQTELQSSRQEMKMALNTQENAAKQQLQEKAQHIALVQQQLAFSEQQQQEQQQQLSRVLDEVSELRHRNTDVEKEAARLAELSREQIEHITELKAQSAQWQQRFETEQAELAKRDSQLQAATAKHEEENKANQDKLNLLQQAEQRLQTQFENVANKIFEKKSATFTEHNKAGLNALLSPLKDQIEGFKKQVSEQHIREGQERASLKTEITSLKALNQQITQEAAALTKALKGDNKQQGNWGEIVLERILAESGLREGHEFITQEHLKNEAGKAYKPDVVVHLPQNKDVVIDSKVSLVAYEQYFNEEDEGLRQQYLHEHISSLRMHIRELGKKDYQTLLGITSLDYILMFVPVEPAYLLAIDQAPELIKQAMDANIMLVSPTNLMVALRTINNIWQYEYQNQNAQEIADKAAKLYDKFHGFVTDMEKLGRNITATQGTFNDAFGKLTSGRGNLVRKVEEFRKLGVQTTKKLETTLVDKAQGTEHEEDA